MTEIPGRWAPDDGDDLELREDHNPERAHENDDPDDALTHDPDGED